MNIQQYIEVFLYMLSNYMPYGYLIFYSFKDRFRYKKPITYATLTANVTLYFIKECLVIVWNLSPNISTLITAVMALVTILLLIDASIKQTGMMLVLIMNLSILPLYLGKFTEGILFYQNSLEMNRWTNSLCILFWEIPIFLIFIRYAKQVIFPTMETSREEEMWDYLWTVPTTFFVIWNVYLARFPYYAAASLQERFTSLIMIIVISGGSFIIYHVTFLLVNEKIKNENISAQYSRLNSKIDEARKARHDMRHHLLLIDTYLQDGKLEELKEYLAQYRNSLPMEEALIFCENYVVNAILTYTKQQANMIDAECKIRVNYPMELPISDQDLTIILGNLLENALDACRRDKQQQPDFQTKIEIMGDYSRNMFLFRVKNTALHMAKKNKDNDFISSKREGNKVGVGIRSVQSIVKKNEGEIEIQQENGYFMTSVAIIK